MYGYYDDPFSIMSEALGAVWSVFAGMMIFIFIISLAYVALYVLQSLGLMKMAKNRGEKLAWLAWLPMVNYFLIGNMVGPVKVGNFEIRKTGVFMAILMLSVSNVAVYGASVIIIIQIIPILGQIVGVLLGIALSLYPLAVTVMSYFVLYKLFKQYEPDKAVMYLILSVFFSSITLAVFYFTHREKPPVELPALDPDDFPNHGRMQ